MRGTQALVHWVLNQEEMGISSHDLALASSEADVPNRLFGDPQVYLIAKYPGMNPSMVVGMNKIESNSS